MTTPAWNHHYIPMRPAQPMFYWKPVAGPEIDYVRYGPWYRRWYRYCCERVRYARHWMFWHIVPGVTITLSDRQNWDIWEYITRKQELAIWLHEKIGTPRFGVARYGYRFNYYNEMIRLRWDQRRWATMILMRWS